MEDWLNQTLIFHHNTGYGDWLNKRKATLHTTKQSYLKGCHLLHMLIYETTRRSIYTFLHCVQNISFKWCYMEPVQLQLHASIFSRKRDYWRVLTTAGPSVKLQHAWLLGNTSPPACASTPLALDTCSRTTFQLSMNTHQSVWCVFLSSSRIDSSWKRNICTFDSKHYSCKDARHFPPTGINHRHTHTQVRLQPPPQ